MKSTKSQGKDRHTKVDASIKSRRTPRPSPAAFVATAGSNLPNEDNATTMDLPNEDASLAPPASISSSQKLNNQDGAEKHEARRVARRVKTSITSEGQEGGVGDSTFKNQEDMVDIFSPGAYSVPGTLLQESLTNEGMENMKADDEGVFDDPLVHGAESVIVAAELVHQVDEPVKYVNDEEWKLKIEQEVESRLVQRDQSLTVAQVVIDDHSRKPDHQAQCAECCRRWKCLLLLVFLCLCGGLVGIILWATGVIEPAAPTPVPTPSPTLDERQQEILAILQNHTNANLTSFQMNVDPTIPQSLALEWLLFNDTDTAPRNAYNSSIVPPTMVLERYGLAVLFFSTNGPEWKNQLAFLTDSHVCDWNDGSQMFLLEQESTATLNTSNLSTTFGVYCNMSLSPLAREVQQIRLSHNNLVGTIPTELGLLSNLQVLILDNNTLEDGVPTELGHLTALEELILHTNILDGTLPTEMGQLTALTHLALYTNNLLGLLPTELGNLTPLERFDIHDNRFTGTLPTELGQWTMLEQLELYRNYIGGTIPTELGLLQALTSLYAQSNALIGTLPTELGQLTDLDQLYVYDNSLSGLVPPEIANFTTAQVIFDPQNVPGFGGGVGMSGTIRPTPDTTDSDTESSAASLSWRGRGGGRPCFSSCWLWWFYTISGMSSILLVFALA